MARMTLSTHWKFLRLGRLLGSRVLARGVLETIWEPCWQVGDGYVGTSDDIEALCEWRGERGALTHALLTAGATKGPGFIEPYDGVMRDASEPQYQVHDFLEHCPDWVRRRRARERETAGGKRCGYCGEEYPTRNAKSHYCSDRCRQAAYRNKRHDSVTICHDSHCNNVTDLSRFATVTNRDSTVTPRADSLEKNTSHDECHDSCHDENGCHGTSQAKPSQSRREEPAYVGGAASRLHRDTTPAAITPEVADVPGLEVDDEFQLDGTKGARKDKLSSPASSPSPVVLSFPVVGQGGPAWHLREDQITRWHVLFPDLDILAEAKRALAWIEADATRRKTAGGMAKCLVAWLNRSTNQPRSRGPTVVTGSLKTAGNAEALKQFLKGRGHVVD